MYKRQGYFSASGATNNYGLIVNAGNVGIGTTAPQGSLDVYSNSGNLWFSGTNELSYGYGLNSDTGWWVNYDGYQGGTTQFRDFIGFTGFFTGKRNRLGVRLAIKIIEPSLRRYWVSQVCFI